jgi:hypothetical protein
MAVLKRAAISAIRARNVKEAHRASVGASIGRDAQTLYGWRSKARWRHDAPGPEVKIADIYVPTARRKLLHPETARALAEDIVENGLKTPIQVREDGKRFVLVEGQHRLEAMKWLGEETIEAYLVQAKRH